MKPDPDYPMFLRNVGYMHGDPIPAGYVPVEPCEHGNIDSHEYLDGDYRETLCPGAAVGEDTP